MSSDFWFLLFATLGCTVLFCAGMYSDDDYNDLDEPVEEKENE